VVIFERRNQYEVWRATSSPALREAGADRVQNGIISVKQVKSRRCS